MVSEGGTKRDFSSGFKTEAEAKHFAEAENWRYLDENRFEWRLEVEEDLSAVKTAALSRNTEEVQAESISYAVCAYFGIETGENSFGYIATWSKGKELPELKASLETINHTASGLITDIDRNYKALMKERGLDKEPESLAAEPAQEIAVQEPEPVSAPDNGSVPDPAISVETMNAYGYTDANMLPLTKERALELMERDVTVYMLHTDNTEAMAFDADEIRSFDSIFGVEASEWETVKDRFAPQDYEKAFLDNPGDSFAIYQLRDSDDTARLHFMNYEYLEKKGLAVQKENYAAVYAGSLDRGGDTQDRLNELYETFNIRRPEDFRGHSLSVSDIVALKQNGVVSCHYVDSWGFKELPGFLKPENYLKNAEMAMEDDYGMIDGIINNGPRKTVAELEEQSQTGTPISLLELAQAVHREDEEKRHAQQPVCREKAAGTGAMTMARNRNVQIIFWVSENEKSMIEEKMAQAGMTNLSAYLRRIAIDGMIVRLELPELKEMVSLLRYASNNINQIARRMNESGRVYDTDLEQVVQNQEQLWDMANGILVRLAGIK